MERDGGRDPKALLSVLETSVLSSAGCMVGEATACRKQCGSGLLVPAITPAMPKQAAGLAALPTELCWGQKLRMNRAIRGM